MSSQDNRRTADFQYTPANRLRKKWKTMLVMFLITLVPIIAKLIFQHDRRNSDLLFAELYCLAALLFAVHLMITWNTVYGFSINEDGVTYRINGILKSSIRWQDVRKVSDADPYYVKLFAASSRPIAVDSMMPIYSMVRRYIAEKISISKIRYVRFWARPMHFGRGKQTSGRPTAAPGGSK